MSTVCVLHPGAMGAAVAGQITAAGHRVLWIPAGRSRATEERAQAAGLEPASGLADALDESDAVMSICPPAAAEDVARQVAQIGYGGIYVEANAISPQRLEKIAALPGLERVVDGSIIGPPPRDREARFYLSGDPDDVATTQALFTDTLVDARDAGTALGAASGLKMAFASFQKAARTLAAVAHALARHHDVDHLLADVAADMPANVLADTAYLPSAAARAWRWAPEMREIADALDHAGLPADQANAAAAVLARWNDQKDNRDLTIDETLDLLSVDTGVDSTDGSPLVIEAGAYQAPDAAFRYRLLDVTAVVPPADVAVALRLQEGDEAVCRRRILLHHDQPVELSASYYLAGLAEGTALAARGKIPGGAPKALADMGLPQRSFIDRVSARPPTREEVETLDLPSRTPVIRQLRVVLTHDDQPVEASVLIKGAHLYELQYRQDIPQDA